ncbi:MAG: alpha-1,2-fucosyltransferase [Minisyncoccia bacterium]
MIKIKLMGGMGNQMFQYATARALGIKNGKNITLNTNYFSNIPKGDTPRHFQLNVFNITGKGSNRKLDNILFLLFFRYLPRIFPALRNEKKQIVLANKLLRFDLSAYLSGYFQNEKYFKDNRNTLLKEFTLNTKLSEEGKRMEKILRENQSVCLNIRRSDYLRPDYVKIYGACTMEYYSLALKYIYTKVEKPLICIFSDDPEWVKKEFKMENVIFAGNDILKDYEQMYLMTQCKHNIIANSSFAWWGAWLNQNPNKIVIAPKQWFANKTANELDILPPEWIQF